MLSYSRYSAIPRPTIVTIVTVLRRGLRSVDGALIITPPNAITATIVAGLARVRFFANARSLATPATAGNYRSYGRGPLTDDGRCPLYHPLTLALLESASATCH